MSAPLHVKLFVASPWDVKPERDRIVMVAERLNGAFEGLIRIEVIRWEDEFYNSSRSFQEQIDAAINRMAEIDIVVCVLWGRIGLKLNPKIWGQSEHTGYQSGTTYEYELAIALSKQNGGVPSTYLFRKSAPIFYRADHAAEDIEQHKLLEAAWIRWTQNADGSNASAYQGFSDTDEFEKQLEGCLTGWLEQRGVVVQGPIWDRRVKGSPFRGLAAFEASHSSVFFGRDASLASTLTKLRTSSFLLVIGASGTGKSSLLRAGLIPRMTKPGAVPNVDLWRVAIVAPSKDTFLDLAQALLAKSCLGVELENQGYTLDKLAQALLRGDESSLSIIRSALESAARAHARVRHYGTPRPARILLAVDQLERLFVEARPDEIEPYANLLHDLVAADLAYAVVTLRSDAYGSFQSVAAFSALRESGATHDLLPPNAIELEDIVTRPIAACHPPLGFEVDASGKSLANVLADDAKGGDSLPLLQMTLEYLFQTEKKRGDGILRFSDYHGMEQAVIQVASEAYAAIDEAARANVPALVTALVHDVSFDPVSGKYSVTAQPVLRARFEQSRPDRRELVDAFVRRRLLTIESFAGEPRVRAVHDALLRVWPEAVKILVENENIIRVRRTIEPLVDQWVDAGKSAESDFLLTSPAMLAGSKQLAERVGDDMSVSMREFIVASLAAEVRRVEQESQRRSAIMSATSEMRARSIPYYRSFALLLLALLLSARIMNPPFVEWLSSLAFDTYQRISPREASAMPVFIVDIDEPSLKEFGQWPWPRTVLTDLVTRLNELGAVVTGFNIVFSDADRSSPGVVANNIRGLDADTRVKLSNLPSNDEIFAAAITRAGRVVVSQIALAENHDSSNAKLSSKAGFALLGDGDPRKFLYVFPGRLHNLPVIEQAAAGLGNISVRPERDGIVRRLPMIIEAAGVMAPSLSLEMLRVATGSSVIAIRTEKAGINSVRLRGINIPTDANGQLWVHFGHHKPERFVSAADVLNRRTPTEVVKGRIALIGSSAFGVQGFNSTPVAASVPGVEIHAEAIENILTGAMLVRPTWVIILELIIIIVIGTALSFLMPLVSARMLSVLSVLFLVAIAGSGWAAFKYWKLLIDPIYPTITAATFILVMTFYIYRHSETQRGKIRRFFDRG